MKTIFLIIDANKTIHKNAAVNLFRLIQSRAKSGQQIRLLLKADQDTREAICFENSLNISTTKSVGNSFSNSASKKEINLESEDNFLDCLDLFKRLNVSLFVVLGKEAVVREEAFYAAIDYSKINNVDLFVDLDAGQKVGFFAQSISSILPDVNLENDTFKESALLKVFEILLDRI